MKVTRLILGDLYTNTYILKENDKALIIDPADSAELIKEEIMENKLVGIILTHGHEDHKKALKDFSAPVFDINNLKEGANDLEGFSFEMIETKGHTDDSISIYFEKENLFFSGDFLFKGTIGRYDFHNSSLTDMRKSIEKVKKMDVKMKILPGHGPFTTLKDEILTNPFFT